MAPSLPVSQKVLKTLMFGSGRSAGQVRFTVATALGITLALGGSTLRAWCFRELGKYFTFEITIQKDHKLVTTGPYSIIRHPSYTGIIMLMASAILLTMTKGSWVRESGLLCGLPGQILVGAFALATGVGNVALLLRIKDEERELRKRFGKQWDRWAVKVRYLLIPGIL
ncbi:hypothetical protein APHAL10511_004660 [Amanita phalloides]|nr:hypothetical protein APHAL10511_004660 [Amanita phalloides]